MKKIFRFLVCLVSLCVCSTSLVFAEQDQTAKQDRWKFATLAPRGVGWARQIQDIVLPIVDQISENTLEVKVYWGGVLGDDRDFVQKMKKEELEGAGLSGMGVAIAVPEMTVLQLPFLFENYDEVDLVKREMRPVFDNLAKKNGYFSIAWVDQDFDRIYSTNLNMSQPQHFKQTTFINWAGAAEETALKVFGAKSISASVYDAPTVVRKGEASAAAAPAAWMVGTQLYSVVRHVTPYVFRYSPALIVITNKTWEDWDENNKKRFWAVRDQTEAKFCKGVRRDNARSLDSMLQYGIQQTPVSKQAITALHNTAETAWEQMTDRFYSKQLLDQILTILSEHRANAQQASISG